MKAMLELVSRIALAWMDKRPFSAEARAKRAQRRAARRARRRGEPELTSELIEIEPVEGEERTMLNGKLTYTSVAALAVAWLAERFGVPLMPEEAESIVLAVVAAAGAIGGLYGRWRATRKAT